MATISLSALEERKRALVVLAAEQRGQLAQYFHGLEKPVLWVELSLRFFRILKGSLGLLAGLGVITLGRRLVGTNRIPSLLLQGVRLLSKLFVMIFNKKHSKKRSKAF